MHRQRQSFSFLRCLRLMHTTLTRGMSFRGEEKSWGTKGTITITPSAKHAHTFDRRSRQARPKKKKSPTGHPGTWNPATRHGKRGKNISPLRNITLELRSHSCRAHCVVTGLPVHRSLWKTGEKKALPCVISCSTTISACRRHRLSSDASDPRPDSTCRFMTTYDSLDFFFWEGGGGGTVWRHLAAPPCCANHDALARPLLIASYHAEKPPPSHTPTESSPTNQSTHQV